MLCNLVLSRHRYVRYQRTKEKILGLNQDDEVPEGDMKIRPPLDPHEMTDPRVNEVRRGALLGGRATTAGMPIGLDRAGVDRW